MLKLVLLRHGESEWNKLNLFTGWTDVVFVNKKVQRKGLEKCIGWSAPRLTKTAQETH